jgi:hypothetical protein
MTESSKRQKPVDDSFGPEYLCSDHLEIAVRDALRTGWTLTIVGAKGGRGCEFVVTGERSYLCASRATVQILAKVR